MFIDCISNIKHFKNSIKEVFGPFYSFSFIFMTNAATLVLVQSEIAFSSFDVKFPIMTQPQQKQRYEIKLAEVIVDPRGEDLTTCQQIKKISCQDLLHVSKDCCEVRIKNQYF